MSGFNIRANLAAAMGLMFLCGSSFAGDRSEKLVDRLQCPTVPFDLSEILTATVPTPSPTRLPSVTIANDTNLSATFGISNHILFPGFRVKPVTWIPKGSFETHSDRHNSDIAPSAEPSVRQLAERSFPESKNPIPIRNSIPSENRSLQLAGFTLHSPDVSDDGFPLYEFRMYEETVWELLSDFTLYLNSASHDKPDGVRHTTSNSFRDRNNSLRNFVLSQQENDRSHIQDSDTTLNHRLMPPANEPIER